MGPLQILWDGDMIPLERPSEQLKYYGMEMGYPPLLRRLDSFDCHKLAMYMLSNGEKILLLFCELFLQFHNNLHLGCNAGDFYEYSMTFYMKDKSKCVIPLIIPENFE